MKLLLKKKALVLRKDQKRRLNMMAGRKEKMGEKLLFRKIQIRTFQKIHLWNHHHF